VPDFDTSVPHIARIYDFLAVTHPARDQVDIATKAEESLTKSMARR